MTFQLVCIEPKELTQYKSDMQEAFQKGFEDAFGKTDAVILPEKEIDPKTYTSEILQPYEKLYLNKNITKRLSDC